VLSPVILGEWRERSPESSRRGRCLPGSSVSDASYCLCMLRCITIMYISDRAITSHFQPLPCPFWGDERVLLSQKSVLLFRMSTSLRVPP
jgi:hypothetical protein